MFKRASYHILRVGMAITFLWIGVLILKSPESWAGYVQPWVLRLLPFGLTETLIGTAFFDLIVGVFLLIDYGTWIAALVGSIHIATVLIVSGITDITIRDIAIIGGTLALMVEALPIKIFMKLENWQHKPIN